MVAEIFLAVAIIILNGLAVAIPKRLSRAEIYFTVVSVLFLEVIIDVFLDLKYDFYGYFNTGVDLQFLIVLFGLYPAANILILNYFPFGTPLMKKVYYIVLISCAYLIFEWLSLEVGYFYYTVWKIWYSALCYPLLIVIMALNLSLFKYVNKPT